MKSYAHVAWGHLLVECVGRVECACLDRGCSVLAHTVMLNSPPQRRSDEDACLDWKYMDSLFFDGWSSLLRTLVAGVLAYVSLVLLVRISGKRTMSKMNAFDLIVTVALGSTLASILTSKDLSLAQGVLAMALLIGMQFLITWSGVRWRWIRSTVAAEATVLLRKGEYLDVPMCKARVTRDEVRAAVRAAGLATTDGVEAVMLETDGSLSVVCHIRNDGGARQGRRNASFRTKEE